MRVLALDTTTSAGSIAIADADGLVATHAGDGARSHTERLPADLLALLATHGWTLDAIDLFAVVSGPGSFTGLRTGIATIQGLAAVRGKRIVAMSALEALGHAAREGQPGGALVAAWMDGRRREIFSTLYRVGAGDAYAPDSLIDVETAQVGTPATTWNRWQEQGTVPHVVAGDGAALYADHIAPTSRVIPHPLLAAVVARAAGAYARAGRSLPPAGVQPIYVRRPDVEVARDAKRERVKAGEKSTTN